MPTSFATAGGAWRYVVENAINLLGDKSFYLFVAIVFVAVLEAMAERRTHQASGLIPKVRRAMEEAVVYSMLIIMGHGLDLYLGLVDTCRRATSVVILAEKTMAALKAASILGYSRITDVLEDVYGQLVHLIQTADDRKQ